MNVIRAAVVPCDDAWVAQAYEVDVAAYGCSKERALSHLAYVLRAQLTATAAERLFSEWVPVPVVAYPIVGEPRFTRRISLGKTHRLIAVSDFPWVDGADTTRQIYLVRLEKEIEGHFHKYAYVEETTDVIPSLFVKSLCRALRINPDSFIYGAN